MAEDKKDSKVMPSSEASKEVKSDGLVNALKEVLTKKTEEKPSTATEYVKPKQRAKIEAEVKMIKIGRDFSGNWLFARSDRITPEQKKMREEMLEKIRSGKRV